MTGIRERLQTITKTGITGRLRITPSDALILLEQRPVEIKVDRELIPSEVKDYVRGKLLESLVIHEASGAFGPVRISHPLIGQRVKVFTGNATGAGSWTSRLLAITPEYFLLDTYVIAIMPGMYLEKAK